MKNICSILNKKLHLHQVYVIRKQHQFWFHVGFNKQWLAQFVAVMIAIATMVFWWKLWLPWWIFIRDSLSHYNVDTVSLKTALESHLSFLMAEFRISVFASTHYPQYIPNYLKRPVSKQQFAQMCRIADPDCSFDRNNSNWFFIPTTLFISKYEAFSRGYVIFCTKLIIYLTSIWSCSGRSDNIQKANGNLKN